MKINKCRKCGSKRLHTLKEDKDAIICIDCGTLHELDYGKVDKLSFIIYKRQYVKNKKEQEND